MRCRRSVGSGSDAEDLPEHRGEVTRGSESDQPRDLRDRQLRRGQDAAGAGDALPDHESVGRYPGAALEESREVIATHADQGRELGEREVFVEVLLDVLGHPPESAPWQRVAVRAHWPTLPQHRKSEALFGGSEESGARQWAFGESHARSPCDGQNETRSPEQNTERPRPATG